MPRRKSSPHTVTGDAREVWHLIVNAREAGIDVASVSHGTCTVVLRETAATTAADKPAREDPRQALYRQFGGELFSRLTGAAPDTGVRGEEYEPALGAEQ